MIKGTKLFDGFVFLGQEFLDKRSRVTTMNDLKKIDPTTIPEGFKVFVQENKTWYEYDSSYNSEITGSWKSANGLEELDSDEFIYAIVDTNGMVLSGIKSDGTVYNPVLEVAGAKIDQTNVDEFIWAVVDSNNTVVFGIKTDGSLYAPKGVPDDVQKRFNELSSLQILKDTEDWLFAFADPNNTVVWGIKTDGTIYQGKGIPDDTLAEFKKVWKRIKQLDGIQVLENDGVWQFAITDPNNKVVLGVLRDGTVYQGKGIPEDSKEEFVRINARLSQLTGLQVLENTDNWLYVIADTNDNVLFGIQKDGSIYQAKGVPQEVEERLSVVEKYGYKVINNDDYLYAIADQNDNILFAIDNKGRIQVNAITGVGTLETVENEKWVYAIYDNNGNILFAILKDGSIWASQFGDINMSQAVSQYYKSLDDQEFIYVMNDSEGKIILGVRWDGSLYMPKGMSEETKTKFKTVNKRLDNLEDVLENSEFKTKIDWSDAKELQIPEPNCAILNILSSYYLSNLSKAGRGGARAGVNYALPTQVEFWDMQGNYFKKWTLMSAQGNSSMGFIKKNLAFDFLNQDPTSDDFDEDDTFSLRIGKWCPFDSFHLKAYYTDFFRGVGVCSYKLYDNIVRTRGNRKDRPWKKELIDMDDVTTTTTSFDHPIEDMDLQFDTGARCFPDGFPVIVFQNGVFYGIYAWQIKKDRNNYHLSKSKPKNIHLDGDLTFNNIWNGRNNINWAGFEIRNPKKLVYAIPQHDNENNEDTYKYDADIIQAEIAGTDDKLGAYTGDWSSTYNNGNGYETNKITKWSDSDGDEHYFINTVEGNTKEPKIDFDKERNIDKDPDFKNKTKCGWINCTNTVKVKDSIMNLSDYIGILRTLCTTPISTSNGDIQIGNYAGSYNTTSNFGKGTWVKNSDKYYMSIHSNNTGNVLTDASNWVDITENITNIKTQFEKCFDPDNLIDYQIVSDLIKNSDGFAKNWQWFTYDGKKWYVGLYDVDMSFGGHFQGNQITSVINYHMGNTLNSATGYIPKFYQDELNARYADLMSAGIIDADAIFRIVYNWTTRIGEHYYEEEYTRWPDSPCIGESTIRETYWTPIMSKKKHQVMSESEWKAQNILEFDPANVKKDNEGNSIYTDDTNTTTIAYQAGDKVYFGLNSTMGFYGFECVKDVPTLDISNRTDNGKRTVTTYSPISYFRHTDNIYRVQKWIEQEVANMNKVYNYTAPTTTSTSISAGTIADIIKG